MYRVTVDPERNLLQITLGGEHNIAEAKEVLARVTEDVERLTEGFTVLTDLSHLKEMETGAVSYISRTMDLCSAKGVAKVVRVIREPWNNFGFNIMSYFHYDEEVQVITCGTLKEAQTRLGGGSCRSVIGGER